MKPHSEPPLSLAIPNKGRLADQSRRLLERAGIRFETGSDRQLVALAWKGRLRVLSVRAADIPGFVAEGAVDIGITGHDLVAETGADVDELLDLGFGACRLVVAAPDRLGASAAQDLPDGATVATSFPNLTRRFFKDRNKPVKVTNVSGAAEAAPHVGVADAIVDLTASGSTLAMNELVELDEILHSTARLVANPTALKDETKHQTADDLRFALQTVLSALGKRYLMMDVPADRLDEVARIVPGIAGPTVMEVAGNPKMRAVHVVVDDADVYDRMRRLKEIGAEGILVVPIDRMVS